MGEPGTSPAPTARLRMMKKNASKGELAAAGVEVALVVLQPLGSREALRAARQVKVTRRKVAY